MRVRTLTQQSSFSWSCEDEETGHLALVWTVGYLVSFVDFNVPRQQLCYATLLPSLLSRPQRLQTRPFPSRDMDLR